MPELNAGGSAKFDKLIKVMEESDDLTAKLLAKRIKVIMYMAIKYNSIIITLHLITIISSKRKDAFSFFNLFFCKSSFSPSSITLLL